MRSDEIKMKINLKEKWKRKTLLNHSALRSIIKYYTNFIRKVI